MSRKTKEEAELTRQKILDAARRIFLDRGVRGASLHEIAIAANVSRGAIYWHFKNKSELFFAMRAQISLPLIDEADFILSEAVISNDPLGIIEKALLAIICTLSRQPTVCETLQILAFRCEYVDEFDSVQKSFLRRTRENMSRVLTLWYQNAAHVRQLKTEIDVSFAADDTTTFMIGLIYDWLANDGSPEINLKAQILIKNHIALRRAY